MLIYQADNGGNNRGKLPSGGVLFSSAIASSMSEVVANPITFYGGVWPQVVISQDGQSGDLYNYYWTSYSRGTDGGFNIYGHKWHNLYLDSYIPLRHKSIYDPCPYGYRIPSNGTYNQFINPGWTLYSYAGGVNWINSWIAASAPLRSGGYYNAGSRPMIRASTPLSLSSSYAVDYSAKKELYVNVTWCTHSYGCSVRCIEECELLLEATDEILSQHLL